MKNWIWLLSLLVFTVALHAQIKEDCLPKQLIVTAHQLNFRSGPSTKSLALDTLDYADLLILEDILPEGKGTYWSGLYSWLKVRRVSTGQQGYVFGKYVSPAEMACPNYYEAHHVQRGNWYGIYRDGFRLMIEKTQPRLLKDDNLPPIIVSKDKHAIIICSQTELREGEIPGRLFEHPNDLLAIGDIKDLVRIGDTKFRLACAGTAVLDAPNFKRIDERVIFFQYHIDGARRDYAEQDLTPCLDQYGEVGYSVLFAGDLNDDGVPEVIISEGTTQNRDGLLLHE